MDHKPIKLKAKAGRPEYLTGRQLECFLEFWDVFADKQGKVDAAGAWVDLRVDRPMFDKIMTGAKIYAENRPWLLKKGGTPKMAQGYLSSRRFEDEAPNEVSTGPAPEAPALTYQREIQKAIDAGSDE